MVNRKAILLAAILGCGLFVLLGQDQTTPAVFTTAQAEAGRVAYENTCGQCHTPSLLGRTGNPDELPPLSSLSTHYQQFIGPRGLVPPLAGTTFLDHFGSKTASQLIARFQEAADTFIAKDTDPETTVNITAYILQVNGAKPGNQPLARTTAAVVRSLTR